MTAGGAGDASIRLDITQADLDAAHARLVLDDVEARAALARWLHDEDDPRGMDPWDRAHRLTVEGYHADADRLTAVLWDAGFTLTRRIH